MQREYKIKHPAYEEELAFYNLVKEGDVKSLKARDDEFTLIDKKESGVLSEDSKRNLLYHLIVTIAMITRFCMEGGMNSETAYNLSDLYIQKADKASTYQELKEIHKEVTFDFAKRMQKLRVENVYSKHIILCLDYIYDHLHETITIKHLAEYINLNETYVAKLFKKETGISVGTYIRNRRIDASEKMLKYSDYSYVDIANYLAFPSHSYFIQVFKRQTGMTPRTYREQYYRKNWNK